MFKLRPFVPVAISSLALLSLQAQYAPAPDTYSVTQANSMMGPAMIQRTWRDGSKAVIEITTPSAQPGGKPTLMRTVYDLAAHTNVTWDPSIPDPQCGGGKFGGDWGDPFASSAQLNAEISKTAQPAGTETIHGISAKVFNADLGPDGKARVWLEPKYGLIMKAELAAPNTASRVILETQSVSFAKPAPSMFAVPAACSAAATAAAAPPIDDQRIAEETGEPASNFAKATTPPATADACTVLFRIVRKGTMETINGGYQIGVDPDVDDQHVPDYQFGPDASGHMIVSGGHLTEMTRQVHGGVLRIENPGKALHLDIRVPNGGGEALIYRQCMGPTTTLLFVINGLNDFTPADWLWVKSGRQAGH